MRKLIPLVVVLVALATLAARAQSPSPASQPSQPETILMLDWREKYERTTYQFVIEPRSPDASGQPTGPLAQYKGAKYHATMTDIDGHISTWTDDIRPEQWRYFQDKVLTLDPFGITQGKVNNPRAILMTLTVRTNLRTTTATFTYPPDKNHRKLVDFLQRSWPGKIEDEIRGVPHNDSETN